MDEDIVAYFKARADFLHVVTRKGAWGWDIVIRIDGSYAHEPEPEFVEHYVKRLTEALAQSGITAPSLRFDIP